MEASINNIIKSLHSTENNYNCFSFFSYYIEILLQENAGGSFVNVALFHEESAFTEDQTNDAVNEVQNIVAQYPIFDEEQVCGS